MRMVQIFIFLFALAVPTQLWADSRGRAPVLRLRLGVNMLNVTAGDTYSRQPLGELLCFNPTILWSLPSFRAMMGVHFMADLASKFGLTPISGIGFSSYFYPFGLSTAYEIGKDDTLLQKSKMGPHVFAMVTPVSFNMNATAEQSPSRAALAFSSFMVEAALGGGFDYPVNPNRVLSVDLQYRFASAQEKSNKTTIAYSGLGLMLTFATSYH